MTTFKDIWIVQKFLDALDEKWYVNPTPIQEQAIPHILAGKDVFGGAQTWTGKTAAFCLPTLQKLDATHDDSTSTKGKRVRIRHLILTPTRELAIQISDNLRAYSKKCNLRSTVIYGGVSQNPQVKVLRKWVEIVVATPGRLLDLINQKHVNLTHVEIFTLDEADRMLDMGFINDIKKISNHIPPTRQTLFFSATMSPKIMKIAEDFLRDPIKIEIAPESSTVDTVSQSLYTVSKSDKKNLLLHLLKNSKIKSAVVFTKTKHGANKVAKILAQEHIKSAAIHGNKSQSARQKALSQLKNWAIRVLVATDVAARGIDVDELSHVIIYDVPLEPEVYVHRIWRTWRAGLEWEAIMFFEPEEMKYFKQVMKLIDQDIPLVKDHPYHLDIDMNKNYPTPKKEQKRWQRRWWYKKPVWARDEKTSDKKPSNKKKYDAQSSGGKDEKRRFWKRRPARSEQEWSTSWEKTSREYRGADDKKRYGKKNDTRSGDRWSRGGKKKYGHKKAK